MISLFLLVLAAVLPAAFLLFIVYRLDKIEKEPGPILRKLLLWGAISCFPAGIIELCLLAVFNAILAEGSLLYSLVKGFVVAALVEEFFKFLFLYKFTFRSPAFNFRFDGVVYAVFMSMGFAILENIFYVLEGGFSSAVSRALLSLPLHATCGVYMGIAFGQQKVLSLYRPTSFWKVAAACLPVPILVHGFYDFCAFAMTEDRLYFVLIFLVFVITVFIITIKRLKKASREDSPVEEVTTDA